MTVEPGPRSLCRGGGKTEGLELLRDGRAAQGIATFSRPISTEELAELERAGLQILFVEAIATGPGPRVTVGSSYSATLAEDLAGLVALQDATLDGVTSATVVVHSAGLYRELSQDARVYLIDLSIEAARRADPDVDVVMNDLYWVLMGWE